MARTGCEHNLFRLVEAFAGCRLARQSITACFTHPAVLRNHFLILQKGHCCKVVALAKVRLTGPYSVDRHLIRQRLPALIVL